jgi:predicted lipoprotein with Yx(FWY)xxD motif
MRISTHLRTLPAIALVGVAAIVAACGSNPPPPQQPISTPTATNAPVATPTTPPAAAATVTPTSEPVPVDGSQVTLFDLPRLGKVLADGQGRVLYLYTRDERDRSNCSGGCLSNWPPLATSGVPQAGDGVNSSSLGVIQTPEGTSQVTYNGWPLYYYANDEMPGDVLGQGSSGVWYVLNAAGEMITKAVPPPVSTVILDTTLGIDDDDY